MVRDFRHWNVYLNKLKDDIYPAPPDGGHTALTKQIVDEWVSELFGIKTVLDVGCGDTAFAEPFFKELGLEYAGITLNTDTKKLREMGIKVRSGDFSFLDMYEDSSFDLVFSRHSLEHSPAPLLTLFEWHRVAKHFLCLVVPNPDHWGRAGHLNHYSVLYPDQWKFLAERAGWKVIWERPPNEEEFWFMFEKVDS